MRLLQRTQALDSSLLRFMLATLTFAVACILVVSPQAPAADVPQREAPHPTATAQQGGPVPTLAAGARGPAKAIISRNDDRATLEFLNRIVAWYRQLAIEERLAVEPVELVFLKNDRQMTSEAVSLAFENARAQVSLSNAEAVASTAGSTDAATGTTTHTPGAVPALDSLRTGQQKAVQELQQLQLQANDLKGKMTRAGRRNDALQGRQLDILQSRIELAQSRVDSYQAMIEFESTAIAGANNLTGLAARIDELERSLPEVWTGPAKPDSTTTQASAADTARYGASQGAGLLNAIETLLGLEREGMTVEDRIADTKVLSAACAKARAPLVGQLGALNRHADGLAAQSTAADVDSNRRLKQEFEELIRRRKLIVDALLPLAKMNVVLQLYLDNLNRWNADIDQRSTSQLRGVIVRLAVLGGLLIVVFATALVWRTLTFRYVQDLRRRRQLLRVRKLVVASVIGLVLAFEFTSELGTLATVLGLAAAGVAVALQNVILSFAGYFFVTGRYGIRVGDRIQLAGVNGDVIEIGLFKLALMELEADGGTHQPTGRVVVFPNSIVFQGNGNFFKPAPGTNFVWNEFKLTLAAECDYRLAEKRLIEVVEEVYAGYRDTVQRQYRELERDLSLVLEAPHPQSRIRLGQNGIEMTIRYPADARRAVHVADEISRRVLDAIAHEPALTLAVPGTPNLLPVSAPLSATAQPVADGTEHAGQATGANDEAIPSSQDPSPAAVLARAQPAVSGAAAGE
jgi:small-conductance mechanosensitive channel